jgi:hypothetical protein
VKRGIGRERRDLSFQAHDAVRVRFGSSRGGDDPVGKVGIAHRPLKRLLRAHRKSDHGPQVRDFQLVDQQPVNGVHVVPNRGDRKARTVKRLRRVAW